MQKELKVALTSMLYDIFKSTAIYSFKKYKNTSIAIITSLVSLMGSRLMEIEFFSIDI